MNHDEIVKTATAGVRELANKLANDFDAVRAELEKAPEVPDDEGLVADTIASAEGLGEAGVELAAQITAGVDLFATHAEYAVEVIGVYRAFAERLRTGVVSPEECEHALQVAERMRAWLDSQSGGVL